MLATSSGSEGVYYSNFPFVAGNNYDVWIFYNFYGSAPADGAYGSLALYADSGVTTHTLDACLDATPTAPARYAMYQNTASGQTFNYYGNGEISTVTQLPAGYDQIWVYPTSSSGTVTLDLWQVRVCPSNGQDITISEPVQSVPTTITATQAIYLQPGFHASSSTSASFIAQILPCSAFSNEIVYSTVRNHDSAAVNPLVAPPVSSTDSAGVTGIRIFPTVGRGTVTLTSTATNLSNANIVVINETGQIMYQLYNTGSTTLQLNLANLPNGMYFVQIRQQTKVTTQKIIINH
jgi:hypothetical protein